MIEGNCSSPVPDGLPNIHYLSGDDWDFKCPSCCILTGDPMVRRRFFLFQSSGHESLTLRNLAFYRGGLDPMVRLEVASVALFSTRSDVMGLFPRSIVIITKAYASNAGVVDS